MSAALSPKHAFLSAFPHHDPKRKVARILGLGVAQRAVVLSCRESFRKLPVVTNQTMYDAFCGDWTADFGKRQPNLAVCHISGVVIRVYHILDYMEVEPGKWRFEGNEAAAWQELIGRNIGSVVNQQGRANPVYFINC